MSIFSQMRHECRVTVKQKSPMRDFRIGLGEKMGILDHDFFSIPMLLNSSELIFAMSRFAPARATNTSKQTDTARTNMDHAPFFIYLLNLVRLEKLYPLTVLIFQIISLMQGICMDKTLRLTFCSSLIYVNICLMLPAIPNSKLD